MQYGSFKKYRWRHNRYIDDVIAEQAKQLGINIDISEHRPQNELPGTSFLCVTLLSHYI